MIDTNADNNPAPGGSKLLFTPHGGGIQSAAYGLVFKAIAVAILAVAGVWAFQMHQLTQLGSTSTSMGSWLWLPWGLMAYTVWFVVTGTTQLNGTFIEQSWMWRKRIDLDDLAYAKLIRVRGLEWLFAPRFYTKNFGGKLFIFYAADPLMLAEFKWLELALDSVRQPR
jgi:hypothetical protein